MRLSSSLLIAITAAASSQVTLGEVADSTVSQASSGIDDVGQSILLKNYNFARADRRRRLPKYLREVSGLTAGSATSVLLHHDNSALVWRFDVSTNSLQEKPLQSESVKGDFEGIAQVGNPAPGPTREPVPTGKSHQILLSSSHATLRTAALTNTGYVLNKSWLKLPFSGQCNFEGLAATHHDTGLTLLLPCKYPRFSDAALTPANDNELYLFRINLNSNLQPVANSAMRLAIDVRPVLKAFRLPRLRPSAIEVVHNRLLILAGKERVILETDLAGKLIYWRRLRLIRHRQAEGLAVLADGTLVIADEGRWLGGTVTTYLPGRPDAKHPSTLSRQYRPASQPH